MVTLVKATRLNERLLIRALQLESKHNREALTASNNGLKTTGSDRGEKICSENTYTIKHKIDRPTTARDCQPNASRN